MVEWTFFKAKSCITKSPGPAPTVGCCHGGQCTMTNENGGEKILTVSKDQAVENPNGQVALAKPLI